jgi:hypothetical protein
MTEIKIGDKISPNGYCKISCETPGVSYVFFNGIHPDYGTCTVDAVVGHRVYFVFEKLPHLRAVAHRKQCRLLVINCSYCKGTGEVSRSGASYYELMTVDQACKKCNGKGKVASRINNKGDSNAKGY